MKEAGHRRAGRVESHLYNSGGQGKLIYRGRKLGAGVVELSPKRYKRTCPGVREMFYVLSVEVTGMYTLIKIYQTRYLIAFIECKLASIKLFKTIFYCK